MKVIYISGSGRSGSTLLERILHATAGCAAVGEFHCLWRLGLDAITCSCGQCAAVDPVWREILDSAGVGARELAQLAALEQTVARSGFIARHGYSIDRLRASVEVQDFLELQFRVFSAVAEKSGRALIVDSSKAGPRAWIMACDSRVRLVHLYRAPADVIGSWRSRKFDAGLGTEMQRLSLGHAAMDWWKVEYLARRLAAQRPVYMVDYHELCRNPRTVVDAMLAASGLAPSREEAWLRPDQVVATHDYHSLNGNPDRFDRSALTISLRHTDWTRYPPVEAAAIRSIGGALSLLYRRPQGL